VDDVFCLFEERGLACNYGPLKGPNEVISFVILEIEKFDGSERAQFECPISLVCTSQEQGTLIDKAAEDPGDPAPREVEQGEKSLIITIKTSSG
jgi:hypothetical protein